MGHRLIWLRIRNIYSVFDWFLSWKAYFQIKYHLFSWETQSASIKAIGREVNTSTEVFVLEILSTRFIGAILLVPHAFQFLCSLKCCQCACAGTPLLCTMGWCFQDIHFSPTATLFAKHFLQNVIFSREKYLMKYIFRNLIHSFCLQIGLMYQNTRKKHFSCSPW